MPHATRLTLIAALLGSAHAAQISIPVHATVRAVCEISLSEGHSLALRCTRDYTPTDPRALPELFGKLPAGTWRLTATHADPRGGTVNDYVLTPTATADTETIFY